MQGTSVNWQHPNPFLIYQTVLPEHTDALGHTNNVTYVKWVENLAWGHSCALGFDLAVYQRENRALVVHKHELNYLKPTYDGDQLMMATWITHNDGKLGVSRAYEIKRQSDNETVFTGSSRFVCVDLKTGRPKRMPASYIQGYRLTI